MPSCAIPMAPSLRLLAQARAIPVLQQDARARRHTTSTPAERFWEPKRTTAETLYSMACCAIATAGSRLSRRRAHALGLTTAQGPTFSFFERFQASTTQAL